MKINAEIKIKYKEAETAKIVFESLNPDNEDFLESEISYNIIHFNLKSDKLGTFLATADDLISSELTIEELLSSASRK